MAEWAWPFLKPGISRLPPQSITVVFEGSLRSMRLAICLMRLPLTKRSPSRIFTVGVTVMILAFLNRVSKVLTSQFLKEIVNPKR